MIASTDATGTSRSGMWRLLRWGAALALLLTPLVMMQFYDDWNWTIGDFLFAGVAIGSVGLLYEVAERLSDRWTYRAGAAVGLASSFLSVWTTLVRDDGDGVGYFLVILAAGVGAFAAWFRAAGLARTMLGVAAMQGLLGLAIATAPITAAVPGAPYRALLTGAFFAGLWLVSGAFFAAAARAEAKAARDQAGT